MDSSKWTNDQKKEAEKRKNTPKGKELQKDVADHQKVFDDAYDTYEKSCEAGKHNVKTYTDYYIAGEELYVAQLQLNDYLLNGT